LGDEEQMLDALGNIGDFLGGVGVVVTLLYLAVQIRQNTRSSRTESYQAAVSSVSDQTFNLWMNPESARVFQVGMFDLEALSPFERNQFTGFMSAMVRNHENIHYQYVSGAIDQSLWLGWEWRIAMTFSLPGVQTWWIDQKKAYSKEFQALIDNLELVPNTLEPPSAV
jgi:hypothetical protein